MQSQLGEQQRAVIVSKAARIIELLSHHCMQYHIGLPARQINSIMLET